MSITLNYKKIGEQGPPILILHGLFGSLDNWQTMAKKIASNNVQVYTIDLRNHGKSPHTQEMSLQVMAEDVQYFMKEHGLNNVSIIGHSMGGKTAMELALRAPEMLKDLIVVDIAPKPYLPHHNTYFDTMLSMDVAAMKSRREAREILETKVKNVAIQQFLLKNLERKKEGGFSWKFNLKALHEHYEQILSGIKGSKQFHKRTLFIRGALSDYISPGDMELIQSYFPQATLETIENAGHWIHAEQPDAFYDSILNFLK